jgi:hypothetical protein
MTRSPKGDDRPNPMVGFHALKDVEEVNLPMLTLPIHSAPLDGITAHISARPVRFDRCERV